MSKAWHSVRTPGGRRAEVKLAHAVLERNAQTNGGRCTVRLPEVCTGKAEQAHHVLGKAITGNDPRYIVASCAACNQKIGNPMRRPDPPARPVSRW